MTGEKHQLRTLQELRRVDRDRFLCAIAAPADLRVDLATLYAFNAELAGIADKVSEPMLGLIRLQWWRDALDEVAAGKGRRHHLVQELAELVARRSLRVDLLRSLIDVRERDVEAWQPNDLAELEEYAGSTAGVLSELALEICLADAPLSWRAGVRRAGTAYGLTGIVRATPYLAHHRRILLPAREMGEAGLDPQQLLEMKPGRQLQSVIRQVAERAGALLIAARQEKLPRRAVAALFPGRLAVAQLERLRRHGYDPFAAGSAAPSGLNVWRLLSARWLGHI